MACGLVGVEMSNTILSNQLCGGAGHKQSRVGPFGERLLLAVIRRTVLQLSGRSIDSTDLDERALHQRVELRVVRRDGETLEALIRHATIGRRRGARRGVVQIAAAVVREERRWRLEDVED